MNGYSAAIKHLEQAQQELRALIDPQKAAEQTSLQVIIMSIDIVKRRINDFGKGEKNG
ncbi:MAG: hypothetical protein NC253_03085 [Ruminococcus sp.]|nr:hypothetical protein [Ruminococcus sp.]MCM1380380.1 hypothetical protein [Muribaculaceae bacterium]MCM1478310.1 hypothetical protein [Muribaculaceae bacterium]